MRTAPLLLSMAISTFVFASTTLGQQFVTKAMVEVTAVEVSGDNSSDTNRDNDVGQLFARAGGTANVDINGSDGGMPTTKNATIVGTARAGIGNLGVSLDGSIFAGTGDEFNGLVGEVGGSSSAEWTDTFVIMDPSRPVGTPFLVQTTLTVSGFQFTGAGSLPARKEPNCQSGCVTFPATSGRAAVAVFLWDLNTGTVGFGDDVREIGRTELNPVGSVDIDQKPPDSIDVLHIMTNGEPYTLGWGISVGGEAKASFTNTALFSADYSSSLNWGGIQSVVNMDTGEPVHGWTGTSASGFDYSKPFGVPEPASLVLVSSALCVFLARSRTRSRRS